MTNPTLIENNQAISDYKERIKGRPTRIKFSLKMQKVAIARVYPSIWPDYEIKEIDEMGGALATSLDISGIDKMLVANDGHVLFLSQRFRRESYWENGYRDFTLREREYWRHQAAFKSGGSIPGFYVCGFAIEDESDFIVLKIINYNLWWKDISNGIIKMKFWETSNEWQENFYYYPLLKIPERYIIFGYPIDDGAW